jgi:HK97 family phage portal protein
VRIKDFLVSAPRKGISDRYFDLKDKASVARYLLDGAQDSLINEYRQLPIVYAVVNAIAQRVSSVPEKFYRAGTDTEIRHPAVERLMSPRFGWTWEQWLQAWVISKELTGEFLAEKSRDETGGVPNSIDNRGRDDYKPHFERGEFTGWVIDNKRIRDAEEVLFDRHVNPWDDLRGLSKLEAVRLSNQTEWSARNFNKRFFDNDATPGGYFRTQDDIGLTEAQRQRLRHDLIESRKGSNNAHSWLLLEGMDVQQTGLSQRDAQFVEQFNLTLHDICAVFGVDPAIIGFEKESKYASAKEARKYFWTDVIIPYLYNIERVVNNQYLAKYNIELHFDTSEIDALQTNYNETVEAAEKLWNMGIPLNMINDRLDLGFEPIPGGDDPKPAAAPMMFDHEPEAKKEMVVGPEVREGAVERAEVHRAIDQILIKDINDPVDRLVSGLNRKLKRYFFDVKKVLEREAKGLSEIETKKLDDDAIDNAISFKKLADIIMGFLTESGVIGWKQVTGQDVSLVNPPEEVINLVANRAGMIKQITENARDEVRRLVREAIAEGLPQRDLEARLVEQVGHAIDNLQSRAGAIARTEVHAAHSEGRYRGMVETGPVAKRWIAAGDARDSHVHFAGQGVVAFDYAYEYEDGPIDYPLAPGAAASEVVNCRCALMPYYEGEAEAERFV